MPFLGSTLHRLIGRHRGREPLGSLAQTGSDLVVTRARRATLDFLKTMSALAPSAKSGAGLGFAQRAITVPTTHANWHSPCDFRPRPRIDHRQRRRRPRAVVADGGSEQPRACGHHQRADRFRGGKRTRRHHHASARRAHRDPHAVCSKRSRDPRSRQARVRLSLATAGAAEHLLGRVRLAGRSVFRRA